MRLRICQRLTGSIDGIPLDQFTRGTIQEIGTELACVLLAEGWAEPLADDDPSTLRSPRLPAATVLVVDDEDGNRRMMAELLSSNGYHVVVAEHGREALDRLREQCPDLVLLDLNMPVMDGWRFRDEQRRLPDRRLSRVPVLVLTGADAEDRHVTKLQPAGLLVKPFDPDTLLRAVAAAIQAA